MQHKSRFIDSMKAGKVCLGTGVTFTDSTVTEALSSTVDFVWIDMEHNALSVDAVQRHIMATKGSNVTSLVRVPWNDPVLIKPVLDVGADGIIIPMVRNAEEARRAVAACLYPPDGIRGFGPRRPNNYGRIGGPEYCRKANDTVIIIPQLEHIDAANNIDAITAVPGISGLVIGPNDLSGTMGLMAQSRHPDVVAAIDKIIQGANKAKLPVGLGIGCDVEDALMWIKKGANWLAMGNDFLLLVQSIDQTLERMRSRLPKA